MSSWTIERHLTGGELDAMILAHLRTVGPHVRGCWAVDLLLDCD
jgi:hypothetical protein